MAGCLEPQKQASLASLAVAMEAADGDLAAETAESALLASVDDDLEPGVAVAKSLVRGGGEGLFALRSFDIGEPLLRECPMAVLDAEAFNRFDKSLLAQQHERLAANGQQQRLVHSDTGSALFRGPPGNARLPAFRDWVAGAWPDESSEYHEQAVSTMLAFAYNAFSSSPGGRLQLIYPVIAKANHSCCPTAFVVAPEKGLGELICNRPIQAGEEVTVSYLSSGYLRQPTKERLTLLMDGWGFACCCFRCTASVDDMRRFTCPCPGCEGSCLALAEGSDRGDAAAEAALSEGGGPNSSEAELLCAACSRCGVCPPCDVVEQWRAEEAKVADLMEELPGGLYSAWAPCEDFAAAHPEHHLSGRWKRHIAIHLERTIDEADDEEEAAELRSEIALHRAALARCEEAGNAAEAEAAAAGSAAAAAGIRAGAVAAEAAVEQ